MKQLLNSDLDGIATKYIKLPHQIEEHAPSAVQENDIPNLYLTDTISTHPIPYNFLHHMTQLILSTNYMVYWQDDFSQGRITRGNLSLQHVSQW